jgi:hypothetical protein
MNKIAKIIYLIESPFNQRDYKRFGVEIFIQAGFEVYVWDFTPFLHPQVDSSVIPPDPIEYKNFMRFNSKRDAIAAISKELENCFVVSLITYQINTFSIFRQISKNKIPYSVLITNSIPNPYSNKSKKYLYIKIRRLTPRKLINHFFIKIPLLLFGVSPATFALAGGARSSTNMPLINSRTEVIWIHALDYDIYLDDKENVNGGKKIAVFLDVYLPFHPDHIHSGINSSVTPDEYYPLLCNFFNYMEEELGLKVVIAAHPRSHYDKLLDFFQGRKVMREKTVELVKKSKLVILHNSTAINFSVLFKKPMIFVTMDELEKTIHGGYISKFASYFKKTSINISKNLDIDLERELFVYEEGYAKYKHDFIKTEGTEETPFWQVVAKKIKFLHRGH